MLTWTEVLVHDHLTFGQIFVRFAVIFSVVAFERVILPPVCYTVCLQRKCPDARLQPEG